MSNANGTHNNGSGFQVAEATDVRDAKQETPDVAVLVNFMYAPALLIVMGLLFLFSL